eukprot:TRINITY_DN35845_c0_g1_i2.p1 TRINITY_DN35845_c0_g1~~TRINITY_DN35845_c0_g1_i2.p1  ORF type:complete len:172 (+),score=13.72 TRINITY_DN35845_c0_g1_i2:34-549(+)
MSQAEQQCQDVELASSSSEISALALREVQELLAEAEEPFGPCVDSSEELGHTESKAFNFFASASSAERIAPKCHQNGNCCNRTSFSLDELRALEAAGIPSVGSILHNRACTPCEYFHRYRTWDANISRSERPPDCTQSRRPIREKRTGTVCRPRSGRPTSSMSRFPWTWKS